MSELLHTLTNAFLTNDHSAGTHQLLCALLEESEQNANGDPNFVSEVRRKEAQEVERARQARIAELRQELDNIGGNQVAQAPVSPWTDEDIKRHHDVFGTETHVVDDVPHDVKDETL